MCSARARVETPPLCTSTSTNSPPVLQRTRTTSQPSMQRHVRRHLLACTLVCLLARVPRRHRGPQGEQRKPRGACRARVRACYCQLAPGTRTERATFQAAYNSACTLATAAGISAGALRSSGTMRGGGGGAPSGAGEVARHASRTCSSHAMSVASPATRRRVTFRGHRDTSLDMQYGPFEAPTRAARSG